MFVLGFIIIFIKFLLSGVFFGVVGWLFVFFCVISNLRGCVVGGKLSLVEMILKSFVM